jgi:uncharacterized protein with GYD domain
VPTYISLISFTQQGIENIKESPNRYDAAKRTLEQLGGQMKDIYLVMGRYDIVAIYEASDDEIAAKFSLALGSKGAVRTETLRAFAEDEYRRIVSSLP